MHFRIFEENTPVSSKRVKKGKFLPLTKITTIKFYRNKKKLRWLHYTFPWSAPVFPTSYALIDFASSLPIALFICVVNDFKEVTNCQEKVHWHCFFIIMGSYSVACLAVVSDEKWEIFYDAIWKELTKFCVRFIWANFWNWFFSHNFSCKLSCFNKNLSVDKSRGIKSRIFFIHFWIVEFLLEIFNVSNRPSEVHPPNS